MRLSVKYHLYFSEDVVSGKNLNDHETLREDLRFFFNYFNQLYFIYLKSANN